MLKEATGVAGGALLFSPLGMPFVLHGVAGAIVGGAGVFVVDSVLKQISVTMNNLDQPKPAESNLVEEGFDLE